MNRMCAICGCVATEKGYVFCNDCRNDMTAMGHPDTSAMPALTPGIPPPTTEYRNTGPTPYRLGMLILVVGMFCAGLIVGLLYRA